MTMLDDIVKELKDRLESRKAYIIEGKCKTFEEYKGMTGEIQGLSVGHNLLTDLVRKIERGEDVE